MSADIRCNRMQHYLHCCVNNIDLQSEKHWCTVDCESSSYTSLWSYLKTSNSSLQTDLLAHFKNWCKDIQVIELIHHVYLFIDFLRQYVVWLHDMSRRGSLQVVNRWNHAGDLRHALATLRVITAVDLPGAFSDVRSEFEIPSRLWRCLQKRTLLRRYSCYKKCPRLQLLCCQSSFPGSCCRVRWWRCFCSRSNREG